MNIVHKVYSKENGNTFMSHSSLAYIYAQSWAPENKEDIKAVFQITHGMAEHSDRYEDFAQYLCSQGYAVFIHEHIGHGKSVKSDEFLGYFGKDDEPWIHLVEDCHQMTKLAKSEYPGLPVILFGHSMGSFVARAYLSKYADELKAAVICGTAGPNPAAGAGIIMANIIGKLYGLNYKTKFLDNLAFGSYNKKFIKTEPDNGFNWLSVNKENVEKYNADKYCGFLFSVSGFKGLFGILKYVSANKWFTSVPKDLPMLLTSGKEDPVGSFGKGVKIVYDKLIDTNHKRADIKLWNGLRHEILNEKTNAEVYEYIAKWVGKKL